MALPPPHASVRSVARPPLVTLPLPFAGARDAARGPVATLPLPFASGTSAARTPPVATPVSAVSVRTAHRAPPIARATRTMWWFRVSMVRSRTPTCLARDATTISTLRRLRGSPLRRSARATTRTRRTPFRPTPRVSLTALQVYTTFSSMPPIIDLPRLASPRLASPLGWRGVADPIAGPTFPIAGPHSLFIDHPSRFQVLPGPRERRVVLCSPGRDECSVHLVELFVE